MTEITLLEIPVQILQVNDGDVLVLRLPDNGEWTDEHRMRLETAVRNALLRSERWVSVVSIPQSVDLAVVKAADMAKL